MKNKTQYGIEITLIGGDKETLYYDTLEQRNFMYNQIVFETPRDSYITEPARTIYMQGVAKIAYIKKQPHRKYRYEEV